MVRHGAGMDPQAANRLAGSRAQVLDSPQPAPCAFCPRKQNLLDMIGKLERNEPIFAPPLGQQQQQQYGGGGYGGGGGGYGGGQAQWGGQPQQGQGQWGGGQQQNKPTTPGGAQQVREGWRVGSGLLWCSAAAASYTPSTCCLPCGVTLCLSFHPCIAVQGGWQQQQGYGGGGGGAWQNQAPNPNLGGGGGWQGGW